MELKNLNFSFSLGRRTFLKHISVLAGVFTVGKGLTMVESAYAAGDPPVWSTIPNQNWTVGTPVFLDLNNYCTDPENDPLTFTLSAALPAGVTLNGSVISGTPTTVTASASYTATADDGGSGLAPNAPSNLREK